MEGIEECVERVRGASCGARSTSAPYALLTRTNFDASPEA
jgi:hypothetical protein